MPWRDALRPYRSRGYGIRSRRAGLPDTIRDQIIFLLNVPGDTDLSTGFPDPNSMGLSKSPPDRPAFTSVLFAPIPVGGSRCSGQQRRDLRKAGVGRTRRELKGHWGRRGAEFSGLTALDDRRKKSILRRPRPPTHVIEASCFRLSETSTAGMLSKRCYEHIIEPCGGGVAQAWGFEAPRRHSGLTGCRGTSGRVRSRGR